MSATKAGYSDWQPQIEAVGSLRAVNGADLSLEVAGVVDSICSSPATTSKQGAVLLKLRAEDDIAKLQSLQATAELAQITYERDQKQLKLQAVSQATLDTDAANLKNAKAQVAQQQAIVDKKILRAPFAGHLGIRAVDLGQYLSAGTAIVTLQALDPIYRRFLRAAAGARRRSSRARRSTVQDRRLSRTRPSPARSRRSIPRSTPAAATCRSAPR